MQQRSPHSPKHNFELLLTQILCRRLTSGPGIVRSKVGSSYDRLRFIPRSYDLSPFPLALCWGHNNFVYPTCPTDFGKLFFLLLNSGQAMSNTILFCALAFCLLRARRNPFVRIFRQLLILVSVCLCTLVVVLTLKKLH